MKTERHALLLSAIMALILGVVGVTMAIVTDSRAILLDGLFNLTYFAVALVAVKVAALTSRPDNDEFPWGYASFESLINAGKGLLILGITAIALYDSLLALFSGGREIFAGPAIAYAAFATLACAATALLLYRAYRREPMPLLRADLQNWLVNTAVSGAVLLAFCAIPVAGVLGLQALTPYVDPLLVAVVVLICLGVPIRMAGSAIMELLGRAPSQAVVAPVRGTIDQVLAPLPVERVYVRMRSPGRIVFISVHVVLPPDFPVQSLTTLDSIRQELDTAIRRRHPRVILDVLFTADERWAAPTAGL